jgi:hypothetical protein
VRHVTITRVTNALICKLCNRSEQGSTCVTDGAHDDGRDVRKRRNPKIASTGAYPPDAHEDGGLVNTSLLRHGYLATLKYERAYLVVTTMYDL